MPINDEFNYYKPVFFYICIKNTYSKLYAYIVQQI